MNASTTLVFQNTNFSIIDRNGTPWLKSSEIAAALGYSREDSVARLFSRNADEFTNAMSDTVKLTVKGFGSGESEKEVRIFSMRGCYALAMFAKTEIAKDFRRWVLDVLDKELPPAHQAVFITPAQKRALQEIVSQRAADYPKDQSAAVFPKLWGALKTHFRISSYSELPAHLFDEACGFLCKCKIDAPQLPPPEAAPLFGQRILMRLEEGGRYSSQVISPTAHIFEMADLDEILKRAGKMIVPIEAVRALQGLAV